MPAPDSTKVLVVDDEPQVAAVMRLMLARAGYQVFEAHSANEALRILSSSPDPIGLVLSDIRLPGMDGYELIARIRALSPRTKLMLTSGFAEEKSVPGVPFLAKPFNKDQLLAAVDAVLAAETAPLVRTAGSGGNGAA